MKHILLLFCICLCGTFSNAQWTADTTMNTIVRDTLGATTPMIASRTDGSTYISWFESGTQGYELRMQLLDSSGYELWAHGGIVVSNYPQNTALFRYDLKTDRVGNAIVAFQDTRTGGVLNVVAYKVTASGTLAWGAAGVQLIDPDSEEGLAPVIGISSSNSVYIVWNADSASKKWIACQRISPTGTAQWNQLYRVKDTVGNLNYSRAKLFPLGNSMQMLYVEESGNFPGVASTLYTQRFDSTSTNFFPSPIQVSTKTIPYFFFPEPVPDANGSFFIAFNTSNPVNPGLNDVYVQYVDYNGNLWSLTGIEAANSTVDHKTTASSCYASMSNEFWVLLQVLDGGQGNSGLSVQSFDAGGSLLLGANGLVLFPQSPIYYLPYSITDALNGIIVSCGYGSFGQVHLVAEKIDHNGNVLWPGVVAPLCAVNSNKDDLQAGKFINNNLVFVWQDDRNGSGVFAQNINGDGQPGIATRVSENISSNLLSLFPNPSNRFTIRFADHSPKLITVSDISGRVVFSEKIPGDIETYSPTLLVSEGIYTVSVNSQDGISFTKWRKTN